MADRLRMPAVRDLGFWQRRKHDKWRAVAAPEPALEGTVADSHAHLHMLPDPAWELARCAANGVDFVCMIVDPSEDGPRPFDELDSWRLAGEACGSGAPAGSGALAGSGVDVRIAVGVHPHNAKLYDAALEAELVARLDDPRVAAVGEIGLDYHYDLSPRDVQRDVFRRQIALAQERELPIALHLRGGEGAGGDAGGGEGAGGAGAGADAGAGGRDAALGDDAHREAFDILQEAGALGPRTLLHCCTLGPDELRPWIDAGCYIAYGGAITFKNADAAREGARLVPEDRLLLETDSPYMTPEPMRGAACTPAHVVFTAARLAEVRGAAPGPARAAFLEQLHANTLNFYR